MKIGSTIQGICFFAIAGLCAKSSAPDFPHKRPYGIAIVSFVFIYFGSFCATWNSAAWVYAAEILPVQGRSIGMGISVSEYLRGILHRWTTPLIPVTGISWLTQFMIGKLNPTSNQLFSTMSLTYHSDGCSTRSSEYILEVLYYPRSLQHRNCPNSVLLQGDETENP